jgi:rhamnogalacturonyl hydrolase YesR
MEDQHNLGQIDQALDRLDHWVERANWKAYDTFDGLASPLAPVFTLNQPRLKQFWQQSIRRFPINLRPLLGIKPATSSKGMGFFAQGHLRMFQITGKEEYLAKMRFCLQWLVDHRSPGFKNFSWGNHFDYQSRGGRIPPEIPTVVWTSLIAHAFLDAYEVVQDEKYLQVAKSVGDFIFEELGWVDTGKDICLSYTPLPGGKPVKGDHGIHNSNVLGAGFLARLNTFIPNPRYVEHATQAVKFTIRDQLPNGAWNYGSEPMHAWVDSFHTGYVLESLDWYTRCTGDRTFQKELQKGYNFFVETFFVADGTPRYYDHKTRPLDIQCASQGIQTLINLREMHPASVKIAINVANWTIANMQDKSGFFYYRKYPLITNKTPTFHWGQATMFAALVLLLQYLRECQNPKLQRLALEHSADV